MQPNRATGEDAPARQEGNATATETEASDADNVSQVQATTLACPECDSTNLTKVHGETVAGIQPDGDGPYRCNDCGTHAEPVERPKGHTGDTRGGLAGRLANADVEDLVTDGGEEIETVPVPVEAVETALAELNRLIDETEGDDPDPLTDRVFRARETFREALSQIAGGEMSACDGRSTNLRCTNAVQPAADGDAAASECIADVADLVDGDRDTHGDAVDQQQAAARAWSWYLKIHGFLEEGDERLQGSDVARMMGLLKISRGGVGEYDLDHDRDLVGYGGIAAACAVREGDADESELSRGGDD